MTIVPPPGARVRFVKEAEKMLGTVVLMGATAPDAVDCSELVAWCYQQVGGENQSKTHTAQRYHDEGRVFAPGEFPLPGDLAFYGSGVSGVSHVAIYDEFGGVISADGATRLITSYSAALANPSHRVRRHNTARFRKDLPYFTARRFKALDVLDNVSR